MRRQRRNLICLDEYPSGKFHLSLIRILVRNILDFSTNDVFEIDYSDYDDQDTESSHASAKLDKINKSTGNGVDKTGSSSDKQYIKEHYMSNSDNELDDLDYRYSRSKSPDKSLKINQIIEDYKKEVGASINHHRESTNQLNNSKTKQVVASKLNQSTNPVIKNYLKTKEQDVTDGYNNNTRVSITTSNKKLNDLSKKSKNFKELTKPKVSNTMGFSTLKTPPPMKSMLHHPTSAKKSKSPSSASHYGRQDSNIDEFQIEKVVSWMSVNEENFSEFEFSMTGQVTSNGEGKSSLTMAKQKVDQHDSTYQEIVDIIKEIEHDRKDNEDFKTLKTDVEFKLNTILNSIESPDDDSQDNGCEEGETGGHNKLK